FRAMGSEVFRQKANDVLDLDRRLLSRLVGQSRDRLAKIEEPVIVVAHELTPAQAASLDVHKVVGFATDAGGRTSHTSIVAAALGIPGVVGCQRVSQSVNDGDQIIVDGKSGVVIARPDPETLAQYQRDIKRQADVAADLLELATLPSVTRDGVPIHRYVKIDLAHEIQSRVGHGGDGVGRDGTLFLYLTSPTEPTEEEHFEAYKQSVALLGGRPLSI